MQFFLTSIKIHPKEYLFKGLNDLMGIEGMEQGVKRVPAVVQALAILRFLAAEPGGHGVTAIARALSISPSSCFNILKTLVLEQFAEFDPETKRYALGYEAVVLARTATDPDNAWQLAKAEVRRLARRFGATVSMWRLVAGRRVVLLGHVEGGQGTRVDLAPGQRLPQLIGAVGRCVAASLNLSEPVLKSRFEELRWDSAPSFHAYLADVAQARRIGWAADRDNHVQGVTSVAAGIDDMSGELRYCLVVSMLSGRVADAGLADIGSALADVAAQLGSRMFGTAAFSPYDAPLPEERG